MIIYLIFWDYPTKMEYVMDYKIISKVISKGELGRKKLMLVIFRLEILILFFLLLPSLVL